MLLYVQDRPITRVLTRYYRDTKILTFYGIRRDESTARSKYNRVEDDAESVKIQKQTVATPIFYWKDIDIWLYILTEQIDFNEAYRLGYDRVGCIVRPQMIQFQEPKIPEFTPFSQKRSA